MSGKFVPSAAKLVLAGWLAGWAGRGCSTLGTQTACAYTSSSAFTDLETPVGA
jgi:hypothetical protein